jgi:hypothetical protein
VTERPKPWRAFAVLPLLCAAPASAQETASVTGAQVLERCTATEIPTVNWCMGFILGVGTVVSDPVIEAKYRICLPPDTDSNAAREAVVEQIGANDMLRDLSGTHAVWYALKKVFGCPGP